MSLIVQTVEIMQWVSCLQMGKCLLEAVRPVVLLGNSLFLIMRKN